MRAALLLLPALLLACGDVTVSERNTPPTASILSPADGAVVPEGEPLTVEGLVADRTTPAADLRVVWSSDVDGQLFDGLPDDRNGNTALLLEEPPAGPLTITLTTFDADGATAAASITLTVSNGAPGAPEVSLGPEEPTTLDALRAEVTSPPVDPEGDEVTLVWRWLRDGAPQNALTGDTVPASATARDETWTVEVRGEDEAGNLSPPGTASVTIRNSPPTTPNVDVDPAPATQAQDISCSASGSEDADGDAVSATYAWSLDGVPQGLTGPVLRWTETKVGDTWTCVATPDDGTDGGESGSASAQVVEGCSAYASDPIAPARVAAAAALDLASGPFTVEAWLRWDCTGGAPRLVGNDTSGGGWALSLVPDGACTAGLRLQAGGGAVESAPVSFGAVGAPVWVHVAAVHQSGSAALYVDGALLESASLPSPGSTSSELLIGQGFGGTLDELRVSSVARYAAGFVPPAQLPADPDTVALWGFEEGDGALTHDLSGRGHDATILAPSGFTGTSSCGIDRPPTDPEVRLSPTWPDAGDDLTCALVTPSVDPEGGAITYSGQWLVDGAATGNTFSSFPDVLPAVNTADGELWTCSVIATDGAQQASDEDSVWVGFQPVCELVVPDPSAAGSTSCSFTPPTAGVLRFTMDNPDASIDGIFTMSAAQVPTTFLFTGPRSWSYLGPQVAGWQSADAEVNVDPSMGAISLTVAYAPTGGSQYTGTDALAVDFVAGVTLDAAAASLIGTNSSCPTCTTPTTVSGTGIPAGDRILLEAVACGAGGGAHGVYADDNGVGGDDGIIKVNTGGAGACRGDGLQSHSIDPGTYTFSIVNEDDYWPDNSGTRTLSVYQYTP